MSFPNLPSLLEARAKDNAAKGIISYPPSNILSPVKTTYAQLLIQAKKNAEALRSRKDFEDGCVVLLHLRDQLESIIWFWTVLYAGALPAMSTPLSSNPEHRAAHLEHLSRMLRNPICITSSEELSQFSVQEAIRPILVKDIEQLGGSSNWRDDWRNTSLPKDIALLMLTSRSTGNSKAVSLSHAQILSAIAGKSSLIELPNDTSFFNWIGMDHVASLVETHLQAMYLGLPQVHIHATDILMNPLEFINMINKHRVSRTFAPNFFLAKLGAALESNDAAPGLDLSCLKYIASGGEANVTNTCATVIDLLSRFGVPRNAIVPGFGMTETCAGSIFNFDCPAYDLDYGLEYASLGRCMPGISMRITDGDSLLPPAVVGDLEITGSVVFSNYFNDDTATAAAFTADGWFKTGDRALTDRFGHLVLAGRTKETIIVNGIKYNPIDIEIAVEEARIPGVTASFTACFSSLRRGAQTEEICVVFLPAYDPEDHLSRLKVSSSISQIVFILTGARAYVIPLDRAILQKSTLGKLSRAKLKTAFERGELKSYEDAQNEAFSLQQSNIHPNPMNQREERMLEIFSNTLEVGREQFDVLTPIFATGITSIELIKLKRNLEEHLELLSEIPMILLMTKPTVRDLAMALDEMLECKEYEPTVVLQHQGAKTPLWLVHPGVGEVLVFLNLSKHIVDRPVYALRARGFNKGEPYFSDLDEIVTTYHKAIKHTQARGPYALAGYSYGTMLAFEVAKRLEADGCEVGFLGSFNLPPHIKSRMRQLDWTECILHLSYFLGLLTEAHARQLAVNLHTKPREEVLATVLTDANKFRMMELSLTPLALFNWANLAYSLQSLAVDYEPSGCVSRMDVFYCTPLAVVAASRDEWLEHHLSKWRDFCREAPRFHEVGGEHYTMLGPEYVVTFQDTLNRALQSNGI